MFDRLYELDLTVLYPVTIILIAGAAELGAWIGRHIRGGATEGADISTLALEEANAIGSTANFALMLPEPAQGPILSLLRDYTAVRIGLGVPIRPSCSVTLRNHWISRPGCGSRRWR